MAMAPPFNPPYNQFADETQKVYEKFRLIVFEEIDGRDSDTVIHERIGTILGLYVEDKVILSFSVHSDGRGPNENGEDARHFSVRIKQSKGWSEIVFRLAISDEYRCPSREWYNGGKD